MRREKNKSYDKKICPNLLKIILTKKALLFFFFFLRPFLLSRMQNAKNISGNKGGQRKKKVMIKQAGELEISRGQVVV